MMRSLYSGVAGLKTHQTKMDVIGNNIANVNTVGFKSSAVLFQDILYQTTQAAAGASENSGGTNAKQIGLGTSTATITASQTSGSAQSTNNPYDLMINGSSFFVVNRGGVNYFTKVGSFKTDDAGNLVTGNGDYVMGWQVDPDDPTQIKRDTVSILKPEAEEFQTAPPEMTSKTYMTGNIAQTDPKLNTADGAITTVSIYDNLGYSYTVKLKITRPLTNGNPTDPSDSTYNVSVESIKDQNNQDILGVKYNLKIEGDTRIKFDPDSGSFVGMNGNKDAKGFEIQLDPIGGAGEVFKDPNQDPPVTGIAVDCSNLKMYATSGECNVETHRGGSDSTGAGRKVGKLTDVSINPQGKMYGVYDNGVNRLLGQIVVANFINPMGLEAIGSSLYKETQASGEFDGIGQDISATGEKMTQGVLEMSNVDLSQEFTEMIVTQRGFQANSRIITVSDTLIEELVNLKR